MSRTDLQDHGDNKPKRKGRWDFNSKFVIGQPGNPMLMRWRILQTPLFGIYVHFIYREDLDPVPHDHPWSFWSFVVHGGYWERLYPDARTPTNRPQRHGMWTMHHFPLRSAHMITSVKRRTITVVFVGRKVRSWGFWDNGGHVNQRPVWVDYRDALRLRPAEGWAAKRPRTGEANDPVVQTS